MRRIDIYDLTRITDVNDLRRLERQMSGRDNFLKIKEWELSSLRSLVEELEKTGDIAGKLEFYYSFQIPKLGKELDLLRIGKDLVINIELKSGEVSDATIIKQLLTNKYYLSALGRQMRFYTYISSEKRLVRLSNSEHLQDSDFETLLADLERLGADSDEDIEDLFKAEKFIISPLADTERFLEQEYFLTSQQRDIKRQILKISKPGSGNKCYFGITGVPGTGKSLLLYDLAMDVTAKRSKACVLHCGSFTEELLHLNERLKRIDFLGKEYFEDVDLSVYDMILVDEAHRLNREGMKKLLAILENARQPVIFSYDYEEMISDMEFDKEPVSMIEELPEFTKFRLTNRIRTNAQLSSFAQNMMHLSEHVHKCSYPKVHVSYANDALEAELMLKGKIRQGFTYLTDTDREEKSGDVAGEMSAGLTEKNAASSQEFEKIVMIVDERFYYDGAGYLRARKDDLSSSPVRTMFHCLNMGKEELALILVGNRPVFEALLEILQGR